MPHELRVGKRTAAFTGLALAALSACTTPEGPTEVFDPYEAQNRDVHAFNVAVDRAVLRPVAVAYGDLPRPVKAGVANFSENLDTPKYIVNDALQGDVEDGVHNLFRFIINSTFGIAGLFDPAGAMGLEPRDNDFGRTLHAWGADEGAYVELPFLGPSTERDAAGRVTDFVLNPVSYVLPSDEAWISPASTVAGLVDTRSRLLGPIDGVLYESADSYAQSRIVYLQNRRFELGATEPDYFDPYEDLYAE